MKRNGSTGTSESAATRGRGFTLLEILVSVAILMMIVMMMSGVFHQVRVSWDIGMRRNSLNLEGRVAVVFMARELSQAVANEKLTCLITEGAKVIEFYMLDEATTNSRAICYVKYDQVDDTVERTVTLYELKKNGYPGAVLSMKSGPLARKVSPNGLQFHVPDSGTTPTYTDTLPEYVDIELHLGRLDAVAKIWVESGGPDRNLATPDDNIRSDM